MRDLGNCAEAWTSTRKPAHRESLRPLRALSTCSIPKHEWRDAIHKEVIESEALLKLSLQALQQGVRRQPSDGSVHWRLTMRKTDLSTQLETVDSLAQAVSQTEMPQARGILVVRR